MLQQETGCMKTLQVLSNCVMSLAKEKDRKLWCYQVLFDTTSGTSAGHTKPSHTTQAPVLGALPSSSLHSMPDPILSTVCLKDDLGPRLFPNLYKPVAVLSPNSIQKRVATAAKVTPLHRGLIM